MSVVDFLVDGLVLAITLLLLIVVIVALSLLLYSMVVYIACSIPAIPMEEKHGDIYWKGEVKHKGEEDNINGFSLLGWLLTWLLILAGVLILIGYVANQYGVNPV